MPGSGLGLAIVKQVVLKHGGTLRVEDAVPGANPPGTAMHVVLPGRPTLRWPPIAADTRSRGRDHGRCRADNGGRGHAQRAEIGYVPNVL